MDTCAHAHTHNLAVERLSIAHEDTIISKYIQNGYFLLFSLMFMKTLKKTTYVACLIFT